MRVGVRLQLRRPGWVRRRSISDYLAALPADGTDDPVMVTYGRLARAEEIGGWSGPTR